MLIYRGLHWNRMV